MIEYIGDLGWVIVFGTKGCGDFVKKSFLYVKFGTPRVPHSTTLLFKMDCDGLGSMVIVCGAKGCGDHIVRSAVRRELGGLPHFSHQHHFLPPPVFFYK